jgi:hypothetical protein
MTQRLLFYFSAGAASERADDQEQTGHKSLTIMCPYIRKGSRFKDNSSAQVGL